MGVAQNERARASRRFWSFGSICQGVILGFMFLSHSQMAERTLKRENPKVHSVRTAELSYASGFVDKGDGSAWLRGLYSKACIYIYIYIYALITMVTKVNRFPKHQGAWKTQRWKSQPEVSGVWAPVLHQSLQALQAPQQLLCRHTHGGPAGRPRARPGAFSPAGKENVVSYVGRTDRTKTMTWKMHLYIYIYIYI